MRKTAVSHPERSPGQGLPEVDVRPVVLIVSAVVAIVVAHQGHPPASPSASALPHLFDVPEVAPALGPKDAEPGGGGTAYCKDTIRIMECLKHRKLAGAQRPS